MGPIVGLKSYSPTLAQNDRLGKKSKIEEKRFYCWVTRPMSY